MQLRTLGLVILAGMGFNLALISPSRAGETTITGTNGKSATVQTDVNRNGNTFDVNRTTTFPGGKTTTSNGSFTTDGSGNYTGTVDRTNRKGETNTYAVEGQRDRSNGTVSNTGTIVGPNGKQSTFDRTRSCSSGLCTGSRVLTFPSGKTRTVETTGVRAGQGNYNGTGTVTRRNGNTRSFSFHHSR